MSKDSILDLLASFPGFAFGGLLIYFLFKACSETPTFWLITLATFAVLCIFSGFWCVIKVYKRERKV